MTGGAVGVIADVLRQHRLVITGYRSQPMCCSCQEGCSGPNGHMLTMEPDEHPEHVAAEVDAALGGLTRAWAAVLPDESHFGPYHESHEFQPGSAREQAEADVAEYEDSRLSTRWVSGWTPVAFEKYIPGRPGETLP